MNITILGLSITSSWGNGHAVTWRGLVAALAERGHRVTFLERDVPWYAANRDLPDPPYAGIGLYDDLEEVVARHGPGLGEADLFIQGSFVPEGASAARRLLPLATGVTAFYDIDTPVTLHELETGDIDYLDRELMPRFDLYLSFSGGRVLETLHREYGCRRPRHLPCAADTTAYRPEPTRHRWDLGYLGTFSEDRREPLERLLVEPARRLPERRFVVAGPGHPEGAEWPPNIERIEHLPAARHRWFYNAQRFTLNLTRAPMVRRGWSPSVRLFEAAACATPVLSDRWDGLSEYFEPGREILVVGATDEVLDLLRHTREDRRAAIGRHARTRVLRDHSPAQRASALEGFVEEVAPRLSSPSAGAARVGMRGAS